MRSEQLDDFGDVSGWMPLASGLAELRLGAELGPHGGALRLDFDFKGGGGFVVARRPIARRMPESYAIAFAIRGVAPANRLELKLADPSGRNVWWRHWDAFELSSEWQALTVPSREIEFAWGPAGGGAMSELGAIELVIAAGPGGAGTVWIADLRLEDRTYRGTPRVTASSSLPGRTPAAVLDDDPTTSWRSEASAGPHVLAVDFGEPREYGGLAITWDAAAPPRAYRVEASDDGTTWTTTHAAEAGDVDRSWVYAPASVARALRLVLDAPDGGCGIADLAVQPFEFSRSMHGFFTHVAGSQPRGWHPRWVTGEQTYWTPVGLPDGDTCAIVNEEGMVEVDRGTWSVEPFVGVDGRLVTWADAEVSLALEDGWLPIPSVHWRTDAVMLTTTAFAGREAGRATLWLRYRVANPGTTPRAIRLVAAIRPFQVNPPWQAFGELGGMRRIGALSWDGRAVHVDDGRVVVPRGPGCTFGAAAFEHGEIPAYLARGELPCRTAVTDTFGYASGALAFDLDVPAGDARDVYLAMPFGPTDPDAVETLARASGAAAFDAAVRNWRARLGAVALRLPAAAVEHGLALRTAAAQILVNRDGPALQPGPRRYTRSWIRDGAIMAAALLRVGCHEAACAFTRWYATQQAADGNVPCVVDRSGPDWLAEHDSHGELVFAVAECFRFTRDRGFLAALWPAVQRAVGYLERLRATRLGPEYETPALRARHGLLPESVSHEGYLAHPVHAYWDDFWALQGYADAALIAHTLGDDAEARRIAAIRDTFRTALRESIRRTIAERNVAYVPGSVEWADFDPTATANAVALLGCVDDMPRDALERTFDQYLEGFRRRRRGEVDWNNYSAYEIRIIGALVRLGRRDDAAELAEFFLGDRRPRAWNQWPEISWRDPRSPGHLGDVPHTWIGAEYVLALRSMFVEEDRSAGSLVVAAGIPAAWLDGGEELAVGGLPTHHGTLELRLQRVSATELALSVRGVDVPPGGIVLRPPLAAPLVSATVDGRAVRTFDAESATLRACPAEVVLRS